MTRATSLLVADHCGEGALILLARTRSFTLICRFPQPELNSESAASTDLAEPKA